MDQGILYDPIFPLSVCVRVRVRVRVYHSTLQIYIFVEMAPKR